MAGAPRVAVIVDTVGEASHLNPLPIDELMGDSLRQIAAVCNWRGGILGSGNRKVGTALGRIVAGRLPTQLSPKAR